MNTADRKRLEQLAETLDAQARTSAEQARAIRYTLTVLDATAGDIAEGTVVDKMLKAQRVRDQQRAALGLDEPTTHTNGHAPDRAALLREALDAGHQTMPAIRAYLAEHGLERSPSNLAKWLHVMGARCSGRSRDATWTLKASRKPSNGSTSSNGAQAPMGDALVAILREHGGPMPMNDLAAAVRERTGKQAGLTGIWTYIKKGIVKKHGRTRKTRAYSLVAP